MFKILIAEDDKELRMMYQRVLPVLKEALEDSPEQKRGF